jgi:hypothetical protein
MAVIVNSLLISIFSVKLIYRFWKRQDEDFSSLGERSCESCFNNSTRKSNIYVFVFAGFKYLTSFYELSLKIWVLWNDERASKKKKWRRISQIRYLSLMRCFIAFIFFDIKFASFHKESEPFWRLSSSHKKIIALSDLLVFVFNNESLVRRSMLMSCF